MRYTAPPHTSDVHTASGIFTVAKDGTISVPDISAYDHEGLVRSGFEPIVDDGEPAKAAPRPVTDLTLPKA